jgi:DNA polymerase
MEPVVEPSLEAETRALLEAAREQLLELIEEGVESFDREPDPPSPRPTGAAAAAGGARPALLARQESLLKEAPPWGDSPSLEEVRAQLGECTRCGLCEERSSIVFGDGNPDADLMFVGEGPGEQEDRQGLPFVGRAGELLTAMIERGLQISRREVYICNIVKCRPPRNRTPLADEVAACRPFLDGQIDAVRPRVIVALGKPASSLLLGREVAITRVRGSWQEYRGIPLMPTFHPAFILRQYTEQNRRLVWEDLKAALARSRE